MADDIDGVQQQMPQEWVVEEVTVVGESAAADDGADVGESPSSGADLARYLVPGAGALLALVALAVLVVLWRKRAQSAAEIEEPEPAPPFLRVPQWRRKEELVEPTSTGRVAEVWVRVGSQAGTVRDRAVRTIRRSPAPEPPPTKREMLARSISAKIPLGSRRSQ